MVTGDKLLIEKGTNSLSVDKFLGSRCLASILITEYIAKWKGSNSDRFVLEFLSLAHASVAL